MSYTIALAGNPNSGKTSLFNELTGSKQHVGNWPGVTVDKKEGIYKKNKDYKILDLPGTYSLFVHSEEERVARDFLCFNKPEVTVVITDASCLERNLNLTLQILEITPRVILCVNLIDEAKRKGITIDTASLAKHLGIPVLATIARNGHGLSELKETVVKMIKGKIILQSYQVPYPEDIETVVKKWQESLAGILPDHLDPRWVALKILEGDQDLIAKIENLIR